MYSLYKNEYGIFKPIEITIRRGLRKKKSRDELIRVIIHIYIEMSQGNSLCSYLKQTKMSFLFTKQKTGEQNRSCLGKRESVTSGNREDVGKGCRRVNMVQILCTHVCKWKNETC
jgi:hypothetical protein